MSRSGFPRTILVRLCDESDAPVYALDDRGTIVYCNAACENWLQCSADDLVGRKCRWQSNHATEDYGEELSFALSPPPHILAGQPGAMLITVPRRSETSEMVPMVRAWGQPLGFHDTDHSVLVVVDRTPVPSVESLDPRSAPLLHEKLLRLRRGHAVKSGWDGLVGESPQQERLRRQILLAGRACDPIQVWGPRGTPVVHLAKAIHSVQAKSEDAARFSVLEGCLLDADSLAEHLTTLTVRPASAPHTILIKDTDCLVPEGQSYLRDWLTHQDRNVRIVASGQSDLMALAGSGKFCSVLACRLTSITIHWPPLDERREDLPLLAQQMVETLNEETGRSISGLAPGALELLQAHTWPGELDELHKRLREAYLATKGPWIVAADFSQIFRDALQISSPSTPAIEPIQLDEVLAEIESRYLARALELAAGNKTLAARLVGWSRAKYLRRCLLLGGVSATDLPDDTSSEEALPEDASISPIEFEES